MDEIRAFHAFLEYFSATYNQSYCFSVTDLRTKISQIIEGNKLMVFYLHHPKDEFSLAFCRFLEEPVIESAFRESEHILYCWDIDDETLNPSLIESFKNSIGDQYIHFIEEKKPAVLLIKSHDGIPFILDVYDNSQYFPRLRNLLMGKSVTDEVLTPLIYQRLMEDYLKDRDFTSYESDEHEFLKKNIGYALHGPPTEGEGLTYKENQLKEIDKLYTQIVTENNSVTKWPDRVTISFVFVCAETLPNEKHQKAKKFAKEDKLYVPEADFVPYPVFVLKKCKRDPDACRLFVDHEGRVYGSWPDYLAKNRLPACLMHYPADARYRSDGRTRFASGASPACDLSTKVAAASDVAAGVTGVMAGGVSAAVSTGAIVGAVPFFALAAPIALPIAAAIGIGSAAYTIGRSIHNLVDRKKHKQAMNFSNSESRSAYLNITGGVLSAATFGALGTLSLLAGSGVQLGQGTTYFIHSIKGASMAVNGVAMGNDLYDAIRARNSSPLFIAQISASILFFGNAVYNFTTVADIIEESETRALNEIESSLRNNRHRRMFNKLFTSSGCAQAEEKPFKIHGIRNVENVDDVMAVLNYSNNDYICFTVEKNKIRLNDKPVELISLGSRNKMGRKIILRRIPENLLSKGPHPVTSKASEWIEQIVESFIINLQLELHNLFSNFEHFVQNYIVEILKGFFCKIDLKIVNYLESTLSDVGVKLVIWVINMLWEIETYQKILYHQHVSPADIMDVVEQLDNDFLSAFTNHMYDKVANMLRKRRRLDNKNTPREQTKCIKCSGYCYAVP